MNVLWVVNMVMPGLAEHLKIQTSASGTWMTDIAERLSKTLGIHLGIACVYGDHYRHIELDGIDYYLLPGDGKNMLFYTKRYERIWMRVVDHFHPDIVHLHGTEYSHGLSLLRVSSDFRSVVSVQGVLARIKDVDLGGLTIWQAMRYRTAGENAHLNGMLEHHWLNVKNAHYEAEILSRVGYANCVNTWDSSLVRSINPSLRCFHLEYNLRDVFYLAMKWRIEDAERYTIFTNPGGTPLKGLHMLIQALAIVRRLHPKTRLVVPGMGDGHGRLRISGGYAKYIHNLINKLGLTDCIDFLGRQSGEEMLAMMRKAHVVVVPSAIEGTSLVLREAMFLGVPCVAAFRGGMADFVSDKQDGFLYDYQEYPYLAQRIAELFESDALCSQFSAKAIMKAEAAHDRERNVQAYVHMYQEVMGGVIPPDSTVMASG